VILIWRGWGLLAVVALFPLLASCAGLITVDPKWIFMLAASLSLLLAGAVCIYCGTRWNCLRTEHSFYFVPLQVWGWVYLAAVGLFALMAVAGGIFRAIKPLPGKPDLGRPDPTLLAAAGGIGLVVVVATAWTLIRSARPRSADETSETTDAVDGFSREP
jgi:hypothetical protein